MRRGEVARLPNVKRASLSFRLFLSSVVVDLVVVLVWNKVLAWRQVRYRTGQIKTSYAETDRYLTELERDPALRFLFEVSSVPLWSWPEVDRTSARADFPHKTSTRLVRDHDLDRDGPLVPRLQDLPGLPYPHDRDITAAKILAAGHAVTACGGDIRHPGSPGVRSPAKQEPQPARAGIPVLQGGE